jgi:isocitrate/isopropylmalate dehydrogenase
MESTGANCRSVTSGLGFAPIANLGDKYAVFDWLNEIERATRLESAIARVIKEGKVRTYDMSALGRTRRGEGGNASTLDVAKAIADYASS